MNFARYLSQTQDRLLELGFAEAAVPADLTGRFGFVLERNEPWGRLRLALPTAPGLSPGEAEGLVAAAGAWVQSEQAARGDRPLYLLLVFPFERRVPDALSAELRGMSQTGPEQRWGVICWSADLEVELLDRHTGFPKVDDRVARVLTEVERDGAHQIWRQATGPAVGRRVRMGRPDLGAMPATRLILATTVAFYLWTVLLGGGLLSILDGLFGGPHWEVLRDWGANDGRLTVYLGEQWRLASHMLLHAGLMHLGFNMYALWNLGRHVEHVYGSVRMAFIYLVAGVAGGIASAALRPTLAFSVGASGAVLGMLGALLYFARAMPGRRVDWRSLMAPLGITLLYGFIFQGIDNYAHIGGVVGGFLAAWVAGIPGERSGVRQYAMGAVLGLVVLILAGVLPILPLRYLF